MDPKPNNQSLTPGSALLPVAGLVVAMFIWGSSFISMKIAFQAYDPWVVIFGRMLLATLCFILFIPRFRETRIIRSDLKYFGLMVLMEPCIYFILEAMALQNTSASQAGMVTAILPLMVAMTAVLWLNESVSRQTYIGFFLAMAGVWWLSLSAESTGDAPNPMLGNFFEFLAMVCAAVYILVLKKLTSHYSPWLLTAMQALAGTLFFLPALFLESTTLPTQLETVPAAAVVYLGTFVTVGAYGLYNYGVSRIPASQATAYVNLIPVFSVVLGFLILGERFTSGQFIASGLVFLGIIVSHLGDRSNRLAMAEADAETTLTRSG